MGFQQKTLSKSLFPSQAVSDQEKRSKKYGEAIGRAIEGEWFKKDSGNSRFYATRASYHRLRLYAKGNQPIQKYKDELSIDGDLSYLNLDWKPVPIIPKFLDIVVNGISERTLTIKAYAQDNESVKKKTDYVESLLSDMRNRDFLEAIQDTFGMNLYKTDRDDVPESEEEVSLKMQLDYKDSIEIAEEEVITNVLDQNRYDLIKRRLDYDIACIGIGCVKNGFNTADGIKAQYVDPADIVYSYSESPHFEDLYYIGEVRRVTIPELKKEFPKMSNEQLEYLEELNSSSIAQNGVYNSIDSTDGNMVFVLYFEYKTFMNQVYKIKDTTTGAKKALLKDDTFNPPKDERSRFEKVDRSIEVVYTGVKVIGIPELLKWEMAENMVRPKSDTTKAKFSYSIVAPRIYRGRIESLVSRMTGFADSIQITHLKLQQVLSRMVPDGVFLDADGFMDVQLGGDVVQKPKEALSMYFQTGSVIGRTMTADGDFNHGKIPIQELQHSASQQKIASLITAYNKYLDMMRDVTGLNEASDGSTPDKDALVGVQKIAALNTNTATRHIVDAGIYLTLDLAEAISLRVSDALEYGNTTKSLISAIGKINVSTLKEIEHLHLHDFGIFIEISPDEEEKQLLENNIQMALSKELIDLDDAIDIREIRNLKLANQLLKLRKREKQEQDRALQLENIQAQTAANIKAAEQAAALEAKKDSVISDNKIKVNQAQMQFDTQLLEREAEIKKDLMTYEFQINRELKELDLQVINKQEEQREDRKDERTRIQASQQSELIEQRNNNAPPKNFESKGNDTLDGFGTENFGPR